MKPYLVIYEKGNGYRCNCCRRTWTSNEIMEFENDEAAKAYAEEHNKNTDQTSDYDDSHVDYIYPLADTTSLV